MSWRPEADEIERRRALAREMGGAEAVAKQHERGRLTVRERIDRLADAGSFYEHGPLAGHAERDAEGNLVAFSPANYVLGFARVDGRPVVMGGEDFTQRGGSPSPAGLRKSVYAEDLACHYRLPLVRFLEGGGGSVAGAAGNAGRKPGAAPPPRPAPEPAFGPPRFLSIARILRIAPVCSAALGAVAGFPAARLAASHFSVMTRDTSQVLIGGPALVERALGERHTKEELGGARVHARSGVVDNVARDEEDALAQMRRFLSYLPTNVSQLPPARRPRTTRTAAKRPCWRSSRAIAGRSTRCAGSWSWWSTRARSSRRPRASAAPRSPPWLASTDGRSACSPTIPPSTAARWTRPAPRRSAAS